MAATKAADILKKLKSMGSRRNIEGMARFGITPGKTYGVPKPAIRAIAKEIGKDHKLAQELWESGILDARVVASLIDEPKKVSESQMESWAKDFDCWDVCDQVCGNLFDKAPFAYGKAAEWGARKEEYVKRAGFALMAWLACHDKKAPDEKFERFFPVIRRASTDERNFVRKAVNWALRNIGKKNIALNKKAIECAKEIQGIDSKSARWIAADALRELQSEKIASRIKKK